MKVVHQISELCQYLAELKRQVEQKKQGSSPACVGLVPTMGYLHEGHISLVQEAKRQTDIVVLSIFVNPLQFGPNEDYDRYPRDKERDLRIAQENGVDVVFMPEVQEMYPHQPPDFRVTVSENLAGKLCGKSRPGHFDGVATVVLKLFQIVQPDKAFFGLKDAQQVAVIRRMTEDLNVPVEIVACPTVRESDGLAKSSRNVYLSGEERSQATVLYEALKQAEQTARDDMQVTPRQLKNLVTERIRQAPLANIEYVELVQYPSLQELEEDVPLANQEFGTVLMAVAVRFGTTRLIDNVLVSMKEG